MRKILPFALLTFGLFCLAVLIQHIGPAVVLRNLQRIGWGLSVVIVVELVIDALNTHGWRYTLPAGARRIPFLSLYCMRQAGVSINAVTPTAMVGGEVVKALLLQRYVPLADGLASVISAKLSFALGQACFTLVGLAAFLHHLLLPTAFKVALVGVFLTIVFACLLFLRLQRQGMFAPLFRFLDFGGVSPALAGLLRSKAVLLDEKLVQFHATRSADFALSVAFHFLAQALGAVQIFILLQWLGIPSSLLTGLAIEAFSLLIEGALFFVPGKVGVQEGGKALIFTALGFSAATGLTVGIAMRLNSLAMTLLGFVMLAVWQGTPTAACGARYDTQPALHE
jgi:uncharacterized membrane protein YbhN (UPF0104 family)